MLMIFYKCYDLQREIDFCLQYSGYFRFPRPHASGYNILSTRQHLVGQNSHNSTVDHVLAPALQKVHRYEDK